MDTSTNSYTASPPPPGSSQTQHGEYELVFQAHGTLNESNGQRLHLSGAIRVIQGPKVNGVTVLHDDTLVFAFLSVGDVNLPLLPNQRARRLSMFQFEFCIPNRRFTIHLNSDTPEELLSEFESVLKWFCIFESSAVAGTTAAAAAATAAATGSYPQPGPPGATGQKGMFERAGDSGVAFVERVGDKINNTITRKLSAPLENARMQETRNVNIGGRATKTMLGGARKVVGTGAGIASTVTDKASNVVGGMLGNNPLMKNMRNAPENSKRSKFHDTLLSGMVAVGKVYVAFDAKGQAIISTTGDNTKEIVREKYGQDAAHAAGDSTRIAVDSYRIMRFPAKFGASALLKGAAKANVKRATGKH